MKTKLTIDKAIFEQELKDYIQSGKSILEKYSKTSISQDKFQALEKEYDYWDDEVKEFLKQRFDNPKNEYFNSFENADNFNMGSLNDIIRGANPYDIMFRYKYFKDKIEPRIEILISLSKKLKFIPGSENNDNKKNINTSMANPKIAAPPYISIRF